MLSRRQLRVKVMQALYAFFQSENSDIGVAERELFRNIDRVNDLYYFILLFLVELGDAEQLNLEESGEKFFKDKEDKLTGFRIDNHPFIAALRTSEVFKETVKKKKLSWQKDHDLVKNTFLAIKKSAAYKEYINNGGSAKEFLLEAVKKHILESTAFRHTIEEINSFWFEDLDFVCHMMLRSIKTFFDQKKLELFGTYKDEEEDKQFVRELFHQTILHNTEYEKAITEKTKNWELDRIALMDIILMKMALAELMTFPSIPVKVSINEYIDISKDFSTPKSNHFINGIIDKLAADFKQNGKIVKTGRGLIE